MSDKKVVHIFNIKKSKTKSTTDVNEFKINITLEPKLDQPEVKEYTTDTYQIVPAEKSNIGNIFDLGDIESEPKQPVLTVRYNLLIEK